MWTCILAKGDDSFSGKKLEDSFVFFFSPRLGRLSLDVDIRAFFVALFLSWYFPFLIRHRLLNIFLLLCSPLFVEPALFLLILPLPRLRRGS